MIDSRDGTRRKPLKSGNEVRPKAPQPHRDPGGNASKERDESPWPQGPRQAY